jgi:T5SS/PEP-CTERM-associated repeat protein
MTFNRQYVWTGSTGGGFSDFHNWSPVFSDQQPPADDDLTIFNSGGALVVDGQNGRVSEIDVVLATTLTVQNGLEATGSLSAGGGAGVALMVDSGGVVIVSSGGEMIGIGAVDVIGFTGDGTVVVAAGGHMDDNGMVLGDRAGGSGTVSVDGAGALLVVANNLPGAPNGILIVGDAGSGTLAVRNGGSLGSSFATLGEQAGAHGSATLNSAAWSGGLFTIGKAGSGSVAVQSGGVLTTVQMVIGAGGTLAVSAALGSSGTVLATGIILAGGTLDLSQGGIVALSGALTTATGPPGAMLIDANVNFTGLGTFTGNVVLNSSGALRATGAGSGTLVLTGNITGTGTVEPLMTLDLNGGVAAGVAIAFSAQTVLEPGVLVLENAAAEGGTISGFAIGNTIDIPGLKFSTTTFIAGTLSSPGTLVLSGGTETPLSLPVVGGYGRHDFIATPDSSGTTVTLAPCFVAGTRIATCAGPWPVEQLAIGMRVKTAFTGTAAVKWIGHRRVDCRRHPNPLDVWPVRVCAHAFAEDQPRRDLWLSPDHAVLIDGVLIPIRYLINDATITSEPRDSVTYWHVELDRHDLLSAEGLACESYLDTGNRGAFANGGKAVNLHPAFALKVWEVAACAELVLGGERLIAAKRDLLGRAAAQGHTLTRESHLHVVVDGNQVDPDIAGATWRIRLPPAARSVRLSSRTWVPIRTTADGEDARRLGVAVANIRLDDKLIRYDDPRLSSGWLDPEPNWRWTGGDAELALAGVYEFAFDVVMTGTYWVTQWKYSNAGSNALVDGHDLATLTTRIGSISQRVDRHAETKHRN